MFKTLIVAGVAAGLLMAPAGAQANHGGDTYRGKRCSEDYTYVHKLSVIRPGPTSCVTARKVMRRWMARDTYSCPLQGSCNVRIGYYGTLWKCYGSRAYARLNPYYVSCSSARDSRQYTWFEYTD